MELLQDYLVPITVAFCYMVGFAMKKIPKLDNKYIPLIVMVCGALFNCWLSWGVSPTIIVAGMASGLASTGADQLVKQLTSKTE